jgi:hypothetical protein
MWVLGLEHYQEHSVEVEWKKVGFVLCYCLYLETYANSILVNYEHCASTSHVANSSVDSFHQRITFHGSYL